MRATPIPDEDLYPGGERVSIAPPPGVDLDACQFIEAIVDEKTGGLGRSFATRWVPEADDLERLAAGEPIWVVIWARQMVPINVTLADQKDLVTVYPCANCEGSVYEYVQGEEGPVWIHYHASETPDCPKAWPRDWEGPDDNPG